MTKSNWLCVFALCPVNPKPDEPVRTFTISQLYSEQHSKHMLKMIQLDYDNRKCKVVSAPLELVILGAV